MSQCLALIYAIPAFLLYINQTPLSTLCIYTASISAQEFLDPRRLSSRCLIYVPFSTFIFSVRATTESPAPPRRSSPSRFHLTEHPKPHTTSSPTSPEPQLEPSRLHPSHPASPPHSSQPTKCSRRTHPHSHFPRKTQLAHCSRSVAFPHSPAGSQGQVYTRAEARRARTPWVVLDMMCRLLGRVGGLTLGDRLVLGDERLSFGLCWSWLVLRLRGGGGQG